MPNTPTPFSPTHWQHIAPELEFLCQYDMYNCDFEDKIA